MGGKDEDTQIMYEGFYFTVLIINISLFLFLSKFESCKEGKLVSW